MARIILSTIGSLGDLHPMIALALELRQRGHTPVLNTLSGYQEKIEEIGFEFFPIRPEIEEEDPELLRRLMDARTGPEVVIKELIMPALHDMYEDVTRACEGADLLVSGELIYVVGSVREKTGIPWVSTSLAPISMFSSHDSSVYPTAEWLEYLRPMPVVFHEALFAFMKWTIRDWFAPWKQFRQDLGLDPDTDPVFTDKYSPLLHLAMFSRALGSPQPDWPDNTVQTGFCFYDQSLYSALESDLVQFLDSGEPPVVFTLGSAAVLDPRDFFEQSAAAANLLSRRAVLIYGHEQPTPQGIGGNVIGVPYAPFSLIFPRAACVVHQGGVGTTAQALKGGVPQLIMPYSHDQPDNAARCRRAGVAEVIDRDSYCVDLAARALARILSDATMRQRAAELKSIVDRETGAIGACDAIDQALSKRDATD